MEIARRVGMPLKVAAKIDESDLDYFEHKIAPLLELPFVEFVGEIGEADKQAFLGKACALLFPIDWSEPFGLVMIEAMACGTPVVAWQGGLVSEVVTPGVSGFIVDSVDDAVEATLAAVKLDRSRCRDAFDQRFTAARMARDYVEVYEDVIASLPRMPKHHGQVA